jgi:hypothetical protein
MDDTLLRLFDKLRATKGRRMNTDLGGKFGSLSCSPCLRDDSGLYLASVFWHLSLDLTYEIHRPATLHRNLDYILRHLPRRLRNQSLGPRRHRARFRGRHFDHGPARRREVIFVDEPGLFCRSGFTPDISRVLRVGRIILIRRVFPNRRVKDNAPYLKTNSVFSVPLW